MAKKPTEFQSISDALRQMLGTFRLESKFDEATLVTSWERLVGGPIAKRTKKVFIKDKVLFVEFKSPSMKNDFLLHKGHVLQLFQKEFGPELVTDIIILWFCDFRVCPAVSLSVVEDRQASKFAILQIPKS